MRSAITYVAAVFSLSIQESNALSQELYSFNCDSSYVHAITYSNDGKSLFAANHNVYRINFGDKTGQKVSPKEFPRGATAMCMTDAGATLVTFHGEVIEGRAAIRISSWNIAKMSAKLSVVLTGANAVRAVSPIARLVVAVTADSGNRAKVWRFEGGNEVATLHVGEDAKSVRVACFSKDGQLLALGGSDGSVRVYEVRTFREKAAFKLPGTIRSLLFTPNGKTLLIASVEPTYDPRHKLTVRDLEEGKELAPFRIFSLAAEIMSISPDGKTLAVLDGPGVALYDFATRKKLTTLQSSHKVGTSQILFSDDGKTIAAAGKRGMVVVWAVPN